MFYILFMQKDGFGYGSKVRITNKTDRFVAGSNANL